MGCAAGQRAPSSLQVTPVFTDFDGGLAFGATVGAGANSLLEGAGGAEDGGAVTTAGTPTELDAGGGDCADSSGFAGAVEVIGAELPPQPARKSSPIVKGRAISFVQSIATCAL